MLSGEKITVVIPCFNEREALSSVLESIPAFVSEVVVVDNCSTDNSAEIAKRHSAKVVKEEIQGYGAALLTGIHNSTGSVIVLLDGDGTYPICDLKEFLAIMEDNELDFISGNRFPLRNPTVMPFVNKIANRIITGIISLLFKVPLKDSQSGFMIFKRGLFNKIMVENKGMGFSQEFKINAWLCGQARCQEVGINYEPRIGKSKFIRGSDSLKNLFSVFDLYKKIKRMAP